MTAASREFVKGLLHRRSRDLGGGTAPRWRRYGRYSETTPKVDVELARN